MAKTPVCPACGSKMVTRVETFYRCSDCKKDFGRTPMSDDGVPMEKAVTGLRFRFGDIVTGSVRLRFIEEPDKDALYEVYDSNEGGLNKFAGVLTATEWVKFKKNLFEKAYVADWDRSYIPVNDGREISANNEWNLAVIVSDAEEIEFSGFDAYPVYWNAFLKLVDPFFENLKTE